MDRHFHGPNARAVLGTIGHARRGEFCYVARSAYPSFEEADKFEIRI